MKLGRTAVVRASNSWGKDGIPDGEFRLTGFHPSWCNAASEELEALMGLYLPAAGFDGKLDGAETEKSTE